MGRSQRQKGKRWEQDVARRYREELPELADKIRRCDQSSGGDHGADVDVASILWNECKVGARPNVLGAWAQVTERRGEDSPMRVVVVKRDHCEPTVTISLTAWLKIVGMLVRTLGVRCVREFLQTADKG